MSNSSSSPNADSSAGSAPNAKPWTARRYSAARGSLTFYKVMAYTTGCFLLALCLELILKYLFDQNWQIGNFQIFAAIAIGHGWCYVVYLIADFRLWQTMRWSILDFLLIALGGVIPLLSFFLETRVHARGTKELDEAVVLAPKSFS